jgi:hypothetical protein
MIMALGRREEGNEINGNSHRLREGRGLEWFLQMVDRLREEERETALEVSCEVW